MNALEEWLLEALMASGVKMLRVEAEVKARVLALLVLMQKDLVSTIANAGELSALSRAGRNAVLRESNDLIATYYGRAQLQVDLFGIAEVESMAVRQALAGVIERAAPGEISAASTLR